MKRQSILALTLCILGFSNAMAGDGPVGDVVCPVTITCNGDQGTCGIPATPNGWGLDTTDGKELMPGVQTLGISKISAKKYPIAIVGRDGYLFNMKCTYKYGSHSSISIDTNVQIPLLGPAWTYDGFGDQQATCTTPTQTTSCTGQHFV
jgi:hypothetical protein